MPSLHTIAAYIRARLPEPPTPGEIAAIEAAVVRVGAAQYQRTQAQSAFVGRMVIHPPSFRPSNSVREKVD